MKKLKPARKPKNWKSYEYYMVRLDGIVPREKIYIDTVFDDAFVWHIFED